MDRSAKRTAATAGGGTLLTPFSPPVKVVHRMATPHTMCPRARVSRMKYTPLVRTARPKTTASSTAARTPPPADTQKP